jgi:hypothetical protein
VLRTITADITALLAALFSWGQECTKAENAVIGIMAG